MNRNCHAFTIIEVLVTTVLVAIVVSTAVAVYSFVMRQGGHATTQAALLLSADAAMGRLAPMLEQAVICDTPTAHGRTFLRVGMPSAGAVETGYTPTSVSSKGYEHYGIGTRYWLYLSDSTGNPSISGDILWRAEVPDATDPVAGDNAWSQYFDNQIGRIANVRSFTYSVDATNHTTTVSLTLAASDSSSILSNSAEASSTEQVTLSRTFYWRNWRQ